MEIDSRLFPLSLYGTFRQVLQGGDFSERKSTEEFHVDQLSQLRLDFRQLIQCIADRREFFSVNGILAWVGFERSNFKLAPAFDRVSYASCNSVVTLRLAGDPRRASSRFAIRCNSEYRVLNSSSAAAPSPHSASLISEEIVGPTRHLPIDETPQSAFQRRAFPRGSQGIQLVQGIGRRKLPV